MPELLELADPSLDERIKQLDDRCEAIILERMHTHRDLGYDTEKLDIEFPIAVALGRLTAVAADLELIGQEITAMSNGAYYTQVNPKTGQMRMVDVFGITGKLSGFHDLSKGHFAYAFDLPPVELDTPLATGQITPKGFSIVAMGGLMSASQRKRFSQPK